MSYIFKLDSKEYIIIDDEVPIRALEFEKRELTYVCKLTPSVETILEQISVKPEKNYVSHMGKLEFISHSSHLTEEMVEKIIENGKNLIEQGREKHAIDPAYLAELGGELEKLAG